MFIDKVKIRVKSGNGGNGCSSFFPRVYGGGPNGGDGGYGGDVLFQGDSNLTSLDKLQWKKVWQAENGKQGSSNQKNGNKGRNLIIKLPLGSEIHYNNEIIYITEEKFLFQKGGKGGLGNVHFTTSVNQAPRLSTQGEQTELLEVLIFLRLKADIGIVGMPNSGKSSFLNRVTNAKSKVADYAFSTLYPCLGTNHGMIFVDVPGLIEGASQNKGLGHKFLSHVEKCKILLILVDISNNPIESLITVQKELAIFGLNQPQVICFNKCERLTKKQQKNIRKKYPYAFFVSVYYGSLQKLLNYLRISLKKYSYSTENSL